MANYLPFTGGNDGGYDEASRYRLAYSPMFFYQLHYGFQDSARLTVLSEEGTPGQHTVYPQHRPYLDPRKHPTPIANTLNFKFSDDGRAGILTIEKFTNYEFTDGDYYAFIRSVFDTLQTTRTDQLIIDLRDNGGGSSGRINYLYKHLATGTFRFSTDAVFTGPARAEPGENRRARRRREAGGRHPAGT